MEKCIYKGKVLYAYQVLQNFEFEQEIRSSHALICCDCGGAVFFKHGKQRAECFAHYNREECKYGEYCSKQSNIFKYIQRELYEPLQRISENRGLQLEQDVVIIPDHYTAFVMRNDSIKYAIDIQDTTTTSLVLNKRSKLYNEAGYHYLQITADKGAMSHPFSERDMAYFPVKYSLNKSLNHTAIIIDKDSREWFIYILDNMDIMDVSQSFHGNHDWVVNNAFAMPLSLESLDIDTKGFFTRASNIEFSNFCNNRRNEKANWIVDQQKRQEQEIIRKAKEREQAEYLRKVQENRIKEEKAKRAKEESERKAKLEAAKLKESILAEQKRQQKIANEKTEIQRIHQLTGCYVGAKVKGQYEQLSLEELTSIKRPNHLGEFSREQFTIKIAELKEYKAYAVTMLFTKMCYINQTEKEILLQILDELRNTDSETAQVLVYLIHRSGMLG